MEGGLPKGPCACGFLTGGHPGHTDIRLDALLKALEDLKHGIADLLDLIALPRNREQHLPPPAPAAMFRRTCPR
jgi:hypothetical protein